MSRSTLLVPLALLLLIGCGGQSQQTQAPLPTPRATLYTFTNLGVVEGYGEGAAMAINDRGQVTGWSLRRETDEHALFLWEGGQIRGLGTFGDWIFPLAINNLGQIVGVAANPNSRSFLWSDGILHDLYLNNGNESFAADINDRGQIVGANFHGSLTIYEAYLWMDGRDIKLWEEFTDSYAHAINNKGQVVGYMAPFAVTESDKIYGEEQGFLWENGTATFLGPNLRPSDINEAGQIVGHFLGSDYYPRPFLWQTGTLIELDHLGGDYGVAERINDAGQIVGASRKPSSDYPTDQFSIDYAATLWERGRTRDLNLMAETGDVHLLRAYDINSRGQIVGQALRKDDRWAAFLLTPLWEGLVTRESGFSTTIETGGALVFDYWSDVLPDSNLGSFFTLQIMAQDAAGNWSLLGQVEEHTSSFGWETVSLQIPASLTGTSTELLLQLSPSDSAADPIFYVKDLRAEP